jgi:hypothetical protein
LVCCLWHHRMNTWIVRLLQMWQNLNIVPTEWFCSLSLFMIYWFGLCVGFFRCSYNHEIGCVMFCHVAKHMCLVLCDISCWLKMKYLVVEWVKGNNIAEIKLYYMWQAFSEKLFWSYEERSVFHKNTKLERQMSLFCCCPGTIQ